MKEQIRELLAHHPNGLRLREIAMYLRCNRFALLNDINDLHKAGIIVDVTVENFVQGEFYAKYYLAEKAPAVRVNHSCDLGF